MLEEITEREQQYYDFICSYVEENSWAPRLDEIAKHFRVRSPTVHRTLKSLERKNYLYCGRNPVTGFYIRIPVSFEVDFPIFEIGVTGVINQYGEVIKFPSKLGHFPITIPGSNLEELIALQIKEDIPSANMKATDFIIFDREKKPEPGNIGLVHSGSGILLVRFHTLEDEPPFVEFSEEDLIRREVFLKDQEEYLYWKPVAFCEETYEYFSNMIQQMDLILLPAPFDYIIATAIHLDRYMTF